MRLVVLIVTLLLRVAKVDFWLASRTHSIHFNIVEILTCMQLLVGLVRHIGLVVGNHLVGRKGIIGRVIGRNTAGWPSCGGRWVYRVIDRFATTELKALSRYD